MARCEKFKNTISKVANIYPGVQMHPTWYEVVELDFSQNNAAVYVKLYNHLNPSSDSLWEHQLK